MARRAITGIAVIAGLIAAALVAGAAYTALKAPLSSATNSNLAPDSCTPGPCANVDGYTLWVSNVTVRNDLVQMKVKFQNSSRSTHASPEDLQLIDAGRHSSMPVTGVSGCSTWTRHVFDNGAVFGPINICFRVNNTTPPFILHWSPDLGEFCCQKDITIWPT
jgi:hypothetical protein